MRRSWGGETIYDALIKHERVVGLATGQIPFMEYRQCDDVVLACVFPYGIKNLQLIGQIDRRCGLVQQQQLRRAN